MPVTNKDVCKTVYHQEFPEIRGELCSVGTTAIIQAENGEMFYPDANDLQVVQPQGKVVQPSLAVKKSV